MLLDSVLKTLSQEPTAYWTTSESKNLASKVSHQQVQQQPRLGMPWGQLKRKESLREAAFALSISIKLH